MYSYRSLFLMLAGILGSSALFAAADVKPVSTAKVDSNTLIFAAPPRESAEEAAKIY